MSFPAKSRHGLPDASSIVVTSPTSQASRGSCKSSAMAWLGCDKARRKWICEITLPNSRSGWEADACASGGVATTSAKHRSRRSAIESPNLSAEYPQSASSALQHKEHAPYAYAQVTTLVKRCEASAPKQLPALLVASCVAKAMRECSMKLQHHSTPYAICIAETHPRAYRTLHQASAKVLAKPMP